jgi:hypothetical protein
VGGPFAGGRPSVFQRSLSLLVRWGAAWGCVGVRWRADGGVGVLRQGPVHALNAGEGLGDATLLRSWRAGFSSVMRIYFSATLRYASAMSRSNFTEVYYFSHAVLLPPDGATITIIPFLKTSPFLYVLFCWSKVASHPPMLATKTFPFTTEMFYSCSLATATLELHLSDDCCLLVLNSVTSTPQWIRRDL